MLKRFAAATFATVLVLVGASQALGANARPMSYEGPVLLPTTGALFGVHLSLDSHNGTDRQTAMLNYETLVGRKMAIDREYYLWDQVFPTPDDYWSAESGRTLYLSWDAAWSNGTCTFWADIASGIYDTTYIDPTAQRLNDFYKTTGSPMFFGFAHEPTTAPPSHQTCGTPQEYIDAWQHVHDRFIADGVAGVTWSLTFTAQQFQKQNAAPYYPGDSYVDVIAADGYNWYGCAFHQGPWRSFGQVFSAFYEFGQLHAKPMVMAEYGTGEDANLEGRKGQWFTDAADQVKRWPLIKGVAYFNVGGGTCARYVDTSPSSLQAFQAMGADPYFNPPVPTTTVTAADFSFTPSTVSVNQGSGVIWSNAGPSNHQPQDTTGMTLFDSGPLAPGATYTFIFISAGNYPYHCAIHPNMTGTVKVPAAASPPTGTITTTFTITWAADNAPTDFTFDVQIQRPGQTGWKRWLMGQGVGSGTFVPDGGTGTYSFRARYHQTVLSKASAYSDPVSIVVS